MTPTTIGPNATPRVVAEGERLLLYNMLECGNKKEKKQNPRTNFDEGIAGGIKLVWLHQRLGSDAQLSPSPFGGRNSMLSDV